MNIFDKILQTIPKENIMKNTIPSSFMGYNKSYVNNLINEQNNKLNTQQNDINYLRNENKKLKEQATKNTSPKS